MDKWADNKSSAFIESTQQRKYNAVLCHVTFPTGRANANRKKYVCECVLYKVIKRKKNIDQLVNSTERCYTVRTLPLLLMQH